MFLGQNEPKKGFSGHKIKMLIQKQIKNFQLKPVKWRSVILTDRDDETSEIRRKRLDTNYCICVMQVIGFTMHNFDVTVRKRKSTERRECY